MQAIVPDFFRSRVGPGAHTSSAVLDHCAAQPLPIDYLHAPFYGQQARQILAYLDSVPATYRPVVILSVGYWEGVTSVPEVYLQMLRVLRVRALRVFVVTIPRVKVPETKSERKVAYGMRNEFLTEWVRRQGAPFTVLDFDRVAEAAQAPPGGAGNNWHYMCSLVWRMECDHCELAHMNTRNGLSEGGFRAYQAMGTPERILATDDGQCVDEMNRNLWQMMFNTLINPGYTASLAAAASTGEGEGEHGTEPGFAQLLPTVEDFLWEEEWLRSAAAIESQQAEQVPGEKYVNNTIDNAKSGDISLAAVVGDPSNRTTSRNGSKVLAGPPLKAKHVHRKLIVPNRMS